MKDQDLRDLECLEIEHALRPGMLLKKTADKLGKHHSPLSREVISRRVASDKGAFGRITNRCVRRTLCLNKSDDQQTQYLPK